MAVDRTESEASARALRLRNVSVSSRADTASSAVDQARSGPVDRVAAHDRRDVLGRLQRAVVDQLDEVVGADGRVGAEEQRDVDDAGVERLVGQATAGVERHDLRELDAVHLAQAVEAERAGRALGRPTEGQLPRDGAEVTHPREPETLGDLAADDEGVGVLRRGGRERLGHGPPQRVHQSGVGHRGIGLGMRAAHAQELHRRAGVLGHDVDESLAQGRGHQLARSEPECPPDPQAGALQGLGVDLSEEPTLGEVERRHRDRLPARGPCPRASDSRERPRAPRRAKE